MFGLLKYWQGVLAAFVVAVLLAQIGLPFVIVLLIFIGQLLLSYFVAPRLFSFDFFDTRNVFDFYIKANEILRNSEQVWFGFEIKEVISQGESLIDRFKTPPPLLVFTLGALYHRIGNYKKAVSLLSKTVENRAVSELSILEPSDELKEYVRTLRSIERSPQEAPRTSSAIRSLERIRRYRGEELLENSRTKFSEAKYLPAVMSENASHADASAHNKDNPLLPKESPSSVTAKHKASPAQNKEVEELYKEHKPITEVLHEIYDSRNN